jgi:hypothetical protein
LKAECSGYLAKALEAKKVDEQGGEEIVAADAAFVGVHCHFQAVGRGEQVWLWVVKCAGLFFVMWQLIWIQVNCLNM